MDTKKIIVMVKQKPTIVVVGTLLYFLGLIFLKWHIQLPVDALLFLLGGIVGMYLLDVAEVFFNLFPSPFRTQVFTIGLVVLGIYIISSTPENLAKGLVLSLGLTVLFSQVTQWKATHDLQNWYTMLFGDVTHSVQKIGIIILGSMMIFESILFLVS